MNLILQRVEYGPQGIFGNLFDENRNVIAETLEHAYAAADGSFFAKIPSDTYKCIRRMSPKFGYEVFMLVNVPNATFIEIHIGNYNRDSDGCIMLGQTKITLGNEEMITNSGATFHKFMDLQKGLDSFILKILPIPNTAGAA